MSINAAVAAWHRKLAVAVRNVRAIFAHPDIRVMYLRVCIYKLNTELYVVNTSFISDDF